jgi:hypothetical protein
MTHKKIRFYNGDLIVSDAFFGHSVLRVLTENGKAHGTCIARDLSN